jgi:predicted kinase
MASILTLTCGISGSGKSKFASFIRGALNARELNADNIRKELGDVSDQSRNEEVFRRLNAQINMYLAGGYNVIVSNTNLRFGSIVDYCKKYPFNEVHLCILKDSEYPELCKERVHSDISSGKNRSNVPDEAIDRQHTQFKELMNILKERELPNNLTVFEIDTTFCIRKVSEKIS